ncbi:hypothetical protein P153DRAFT_423238 [Dothidotthia symphoricarpi CBS 119687]|uniref:PHD-type domain-containing protein n=1 Tax=Dothidotthia symphoricarpi CBS 119687 TaxID=1392245 RepID=A0A6A6ABX7_9PLEO|nr:uncharacterized protein P153DRAFT_423238 [Dothidotthia symphoricarpi CBS 119687]KAF2128733.1 hypothetical protein P153DRAFT_423238 [Dothidotthia symphoricarpi CBS 119687]
MAEGDDALDEPQPAPNPDALTTVNDFLDYTEYFPSDLVRSLTLIGDCDQAYRDAAQHVHDLAALYGRLPALPDDERPDPAALRRQMARRLQHAISQRHFACTEAARLYELSLRHCHRSAVIRRKLHAQPQPPSRDPTPAAVSPPPARPLHRPADRPAHLRLTFDAARHRNTAVPLPSRRARAHSPDSDSGSDRDADVDARKPKRPADRPPKPARARAAGGVLGTNVHSTIAGISTSNALAQLHPPPPDARPGSRWAPWRKLTEYEMAVLRKSMKKNAVWTPSLTMVNRELERKHRTKGDFERERARCEAAGDVFLDEQPETLQQIMAAQGMGDQIVNVPAAEAPARSSEPVDDDAGEDVTVAIRTGPVEAKDGRNLDRSTRRQKALRDTQVLEDATKNLTMAADGLKELTFVSAAVAASSAQKRKTPARSSNKRKRDASPPPALETATEATNDASPAHADSAAEEPDAKRQRVELTAPSPSPDAPASPLGSVHSTPDMEEPLPEDPGALAVDAIDPALESATPASEAMDTAADADSASAVPVASAPQTPVVSHVEESVPAQTSPSAAPSPTAHPPVPSPEKPKTASSTTTLQVPLAPAGPSTPEVNKKQETKPSHEQPTVASQPPNEPADQPVALATTPNSVVPISDTPPASPSPATPTTVPVVPAPSTSPTSPTEIAPLPESGSAVDISAGIAATAPASPSDQGPLADDPPAESASVSPLSGPVTSTHAAESAHSSAATPLAPPAPPRSTSTAASSRPKRESTAPKASSPNPIPAHPKKPSSTSSPAPTPALEPTQMVMRSHSRSHVPTPKALSEEPKALEAGRTTRGTRRHSIFSQSALTAPVAIRVSRRKKPPPKGEITSAEGGPKTITNTKRQGRTRDRRRKPAEEEEEMEEDTDSIHPDETRYCICNNVSDGDMISCDNNCENEWFHFACVGLEDTPPKRAKWYCPDCRVLLGTDAYGNPLVPPPLPGRRGNR